MISSDDIRAKDPLPRGAGSFVFSLPRVTRFYVPLLLQAFSQSLSYPLVAGIVSHGPLGIDALTAFSQGLMIMFTIGALGCGLLTTGLVFAKTWYGYVSFKRLNALMMTALLILQCLPAMPPFNTWVFDGLLALPPELSSVARWILVASVVMNACFFMRNVSMAVLFNNLDSGKANNATMIRIVATVICSYLFPKLGWVGAMWGLAALTFGAFLEFVITWCYARPYVRALRQTGVNVPTPTHSEIISLTFEQFRFSMPLALGGFLLATSPIAIAIFVARTPNPSDMLAITYTSLGVANPVAYAALRIQPVSIKFPPEYPGDHRLLWFSIAVGALLGLIPLVFYTPLVGNWYFATYQAVPPRILSTARLATGIYAFICVIHAVRARIEGIAAAYKDSRAIMVGQITYTVTLFLVCVILLPFGASGWVLAETAIFIAPVFTTISIYIALLIRRQGQTLGWKT